MIRALIFSLIIFVNTAAFGTQDLDDCHRSVEPSVGKSVKAFNMGGFFWRPYAHNLWIALGKSPEMADAINTAAWIEKNFGRQEYMGITWNVRAVLPVDKEITKAGAVLVLDSPKFKNLPGSYSLHKNAQIVIPADGVWTEVSSCYGYKIGDKLADGKITKFYSDHTAQLNNGTLAYLGVKPMDAPLYVGAKVLTIGSERPYFSEYTYGTITKISKNTVYVKAHQRGFYSEKDPGYGKPFPVDAKLVFPEVSDFKPLGIAKYMEFVARNALAPFNDGPYYAKAINIFSNGYVLADSSTLSFGQFHELRLIRVNDIKR